MTLSAKPNVLQPLGGVQKGGERGLEPCVELSDGPFELLDRLQVLPDQEAMMIARTSVQRGGEILAGAGEPRMAEFGQSSQIALPCDDCLQDAPAAEAQDVGNDRGELDVGFLQRRLNPLGVTDDLARQFAPRPGQVAQFLNRLRRHETGADETVGEEIGDPRRIVGVALAARHIANARGVGENQAEVLAQHVPDRLPIDAGRLHRHVRHLGFGQPRRRRQKALRRGRKPTQLRLNLAARGDPPAGHDLLLMHVQSRASSMQRLHRALLQQRGRRDDPEDRYSLLRAPGAAAETASPWRQSKVRLGHPIKLNFGFKTPRGKRSPCRPPEHSTPFHQSRYAQRMTTQLNNALICHLFFFSVSITGASIRAHQPRVPQRLEVRQVAQRFEPELEQKFLRRHVAYGAPGVGLRGPAAISPSSRKDAIRSREISRPNISEISPRVTGWKYATAINTPASSFVSCLTSAGMSKATRTAGANVCLV